jgi:hypothetical protein
MMKAVIAVKILEATELISERAGISLRGQSDPISGALAKSASGPGP